MPPIFVTETPTTDSPLFFSSSITDQTKKSGIAPWALAIIVLFALALGVGLVVAIFLIHRHMKQNRENALKRQEKSRRSIILSLSPKSKDIFERSLARSKSKSDSDSDTDRSTTLIRSITSAASAGKVPVLPSKRLANSETRKKRTPGAIDMVEKDLRTGVNLADSKFGKSTVKRKARKLKSKSGFAASTTPPTETIPLKSMEKFVVKKIDDVYSKVEAKRRPRHFSFSKYYSKSNKPKEKDGSEKDKETIASKTVVFEREEKKEKSISSRTSSSSSSSINGSANGKKTSSDLVKKK